VLRSPEEEARINLFVAGALDGLIAVCPVCERYGRLVVVSDEDGPVDASCVPCASRPLLDMEPIMGALRAALSDLRNS